MLEKNRSVAASECGLENKEVGIGLASMKSLVCVCGN